MKHTRKNYRKFRQAAPATPLPCRSYQITLIHAAGRTVRNVIAHSTMQAVMIGINMLPDTTKPVSLFCKPAERNCHVA